MLNRTKHTDERGGFSLIEVVVALMILMTGVLGLAASSGGMARTNQVIELKELSLQAVADRLSEISLDPNYAALDSLYSGTESTVVGLEGFTRVSVVAQSVTTTPAGITDYSLVTVTVSGPGLPNDIGRTIIVGAP